MCITLAPALLGRQLGDLHMQQMRLPAREGGLSLDDGSEDAPRKHSDSRECTEQLTQLIVESVSKLPSPKNNRDAGIGKLVQKRNAERLAKEADAVQARLTESCQKRAMEGARMKGGSLVLTTMPIAEHGFHLASKADFHDFLLLHFGWPLPKLPETCPCGSAYSVDHGQICKLGGFIHRRHDDVVDLLGRRMKQCYIDVEVEPPLQKLTGEQLTKYKTANGVAKAQKAT